jgi:hypothetical protein
MKISYHILILLAIRHQFVGIFRSAMRTFVRFCVIIDSDSLCHDVREGVDVGMHLGNIPILVVVVALLANSFVCLVNRVAY